MEEVAPGLLMIILSLHSNGTGLALKGMKAR